MVQQIVDELVKSALQRTHTHYKKDLDFMLKLIREGTRSEDVDELWRVYKKYITTTCGKPSQTCGECGHSCGEYNYVLGTYLGKYKGSWEDEPKVEVVGATYSK